MITITDAIISLGITEYVLRGEPTSSSEFNSMFSKVTSINSNGIAIESNDPDDFGTTWTAVKEKYDELTATYNAQEYARKRKVKYDALNQFELISDDAINGTTTHKDAILAIKSEFPKPQE